MIFAIGHGDRLRWLGSAGAAESAREAAAASEPTVVAAELAIPDLASPAGAAEAIAITAPSAESFGYLFPDADEIGPGDRKAALEALAKAMAEAAGDPADDNADIAPIVTYFGQFIDHDVTAGTNTDAVTEALRIDAATIVPQNRSLVVTGLGNMRKGSLGLDSLYGDGPISGPMNDKLQAAMRDPADPRRMRVGHVLPLNGGAFPTKRPTLPLALPGGDTQADLPRVKSIVGSAQFPDAAALPETLRPVDGADVRWDRRAFIGDSRNDENIIVAQLHTAFLRLHNAFVDRLGSSGTFEQARQLTSWHYQWLVVNDYLKAICDADVLAAVISAEAPLYQRFHDARIANLPKGVLPLPLEFSTAAYRFGHSMVRAEYDYNQNFTRGSAGQVPGAFGLMFAFTGNGAKPIGIAASITLPDNWIIEWARFTTVQPGNPLGSARKIDTMLAPPLFTMTNESSAAAGLFQRLAERNLKRGHIQNLPTAQALIAKMCAAGFGVSGELTADEIASGPTGAAVRDNGFDTATPLWFYVLKEAELLGTSATASGGGHHLGPLGSRIVAETLIGLIVRDPQSYWNRTGGRWEPAMAATGGAAAIDSMPAMLAAAGVM